ncbi:unnamed protein product [Owenia fusiformis]|uniref:Uncharacterized protein n=1 Tax=Owenia fusiformis TaxID=6347 RepID=A0A8J1TWI5_OWEFU|nr:unnamed protein product [Owenia fusiformis]
MQTMASKMKNKGLIDKTLTTVDKDVLKSNGFTHNTEDDAENTELEMDPEAVKLERQTKRNQTEQKRKVKIRALIMQMGALLPDSSKTIEKKGSRPMTEVLEESIARLKFLNERDENFLMSHVTEIQAEEMTRLRNEIDSLKEENTRLKNLFEQKDFPTDSLENLEKLWKEAKFTRLELNSDFVKKLGTIRPGKTKSSRKSNIRNLVVAEEQAALNETLNEITSAENFAFKPDGGMAGLQNFTNTQTAVFNNGAMYMSPQGQIQQGMPPQGMLPQVSQPQGMLPQVSQPQGMLPQVSQPQGMLPQVSQPQGMLPQVSQQQGMLTIDTGNTQETQSDTAPASTTMTMSSENLPPQGGQNLISTMPPGMIMPQPTHPGQVLLINEHGQPIGFGGPTLEMPNKDGTSEQSSGAPGGMMFPPGMPNLPQNLVQTGPGQFMTNNSLPQALILPNGQIVPVVTQPIVMPPPGQPISSNMMIPNSQGILAHPGGINNEINTQFTMKPPNQVSQPQTMAPQVSQPQTTTSSDSDSTVTSQPTSLCTSTSVTFTTLAQNSQTSQPIAIGSSIATSAGQLICQPPIISSMGHRPIMHQVPGQPNQAPVMMSTNNTLTTTATSDGNAIGSNVNSGPGPNAIGPNGNIIGPGGQTVGPNGSIIGLGGNQLGPNGTMIGIPGNIRPPGVTVNGQGQLIGPPGAIGPPGTMFNGPGHPPSGNTVTATVLTSNGKIIIQLPPGGQIDPNTIITTPGLGLPGSPLGALGQKKAAGQRLLMPKPGTGSVVRPPIDNNTPISTLWNTPLISNSDNETVQKNLNEINQKTPSKSKNGKKKSTKAKIKVEKKDPSAGTKDDDILAKATASIFSNIEISPPIGGIHDGAPDEDNPLQIDMGAMEHDTYNTTNSQNLDNSQTSQSSSSPNKSKENNVSVNNPSNQSNVMISIRGVTTHSSSITSDEVTNDDSQSQPVTSCEPTTTTMTTTSSVSSTASVTSVSTQMTSSTSNVTLSSPSVTSPNKNTKKESSTMSTSPSTPQKQTSDTTTGMSSHQNNSITTPTTVSPSSKTAANVLLSMPMIGGSPPLMGNPSPNSLSMVNTFNNTVGNINTSGSTIPSNMFAHGLNMPSFSDLQPNPNAFNRNNKESQKKKEFPPAETPKKSKSRHQSKSKKAQHTEEIKDSKTETPPKPDEPNESNDDLTYKGFSPLHTSETNKKSSKSSKKGDRSQSKHEKVEHEKPSKNKSSKDAGKVPPVSTDIVMDTIDSVVSSYTMHDESPTKDSPEKQTPKTETPPKYPELKHSFIPESDDLDTKKSKRKSRKSRQKSAEREPLTMPPPPPHEESQEEVLLPWQIAEDKNQNHIKSPPIVEQPMDLAIKNHEESVAKKQQESPISKKSKKKDKRKSVELPNTISFSENDLEDVLDQVESFGKPEPRKSRTRSKHKSNTDTDQEPAPKKQKVEEKRQSLTEELKISTGTSDNIIVGELTPGTSGSDPKRRTSIDWDTEVLGKSNVNMHKKFRPEGIKAPLEAKQATSRDVYDFNDFDDSPPSATLRKEPGLFKSPKSQLKEPVEKPLDLPKPRSPLKSPKPPKSTSETKKQVDKIPEYKPPPPQVYTPPQVKRKDRIHESEAKLKLNEHTRSEASINHPPTSTPVNKGNQSDVGKEIKEKESKDRVPEVTSAGPQPHLSTYPIKKHRIQRASEPKPQLVSEPPIVTPDVPTYSEGNSSSKASSSGAPCTRSTPPVSVVASVSTVTSINTGPISSAASLSSNPITSVPSMSSGAMSGGPISSVPSISSGPMNSVPSMSSGPPVSTLATVTKTLSSTGMISSSIPTLSSGPSLSGGPPLAVVSKDSMPKLIPDKKSQEAAALAAAAQNRHAENKLEKPVSKLPQYQDHQQPQGQDMNRYQQDFPVSVNNTNTANSQFVAPNVQTSTQAVMGNTSKDNINVPFSSNSNQSFSFSVTSATSTPPASTASNSVPKAVSSHAMVPAASRVNPTPPPPVRHTERHKPASKPGENRPGPFPFYPLHPSITSPGGGAHNPPVSSFNNFSGERPLDSSIPPLSFPPISLDIPSVGGPQRGQGNSHMLPQTTQMNLPYGGLGEDQKHTSQASSQMHQPPGGLNLNPPFSMDMSMNRPPNMFTSNPQLAPGRGSTAPPFRSMANDIPAQTSRPYTQNPQNMEMPNFSMGRNDGGNMKRMSQQRSAPQAPMQPSQPAPPSNMPHPNTLTSPQPQQRRGSYPNFPMPDNMHPREGHDFRDLTPLSGPDKSRTPQHQAHNRNEPGYFPGMQQSGPPSGSNLPPSNLRLHHNSDASSQASNFDPSQNTMPPMPSFSSATFDPPMLQLPTDTSPAPSQPPPPQAPSYPTSQPPAQPMRKPSTDRSTTSRKETTQPPSSSAPSSRSSSKSTKSKAKSKSKSNNANRYHEVDTNLSNSIFEQGRSMTPYFSHLGIPSPPPSRNMQSSEIPTYLPSNIFGGPPRPLSNANNSQFNKQDLGNPYALFPPPPRHQNGMGSLGFQPTGFSMNPMHGQPSSQSLPTHSSVGVTPHVPTFSLSNIFPDINSQSSDSINISPIKFPHGNPMLPPSQSSMDHPSIPAHQPGSLYQHRPSPGVLPGGLGLLGQHHHQMFDPRVPQGNPNMGPHTFHGHPGHPPTFGFPL